MGADDRVVLAGVELGELTDALRTVALEVDAVDSDGDLPAPSKPNSLLALDGADAERGLLGDPVCDAALADVWGGPRGP